MYSDFEFYDSRHHAKWRDAGSSYSAPFLSQEEVADIPVLDPVSAHIELIEGNNVLREVIADAVVGNIILLIGDKDLFVLQVPPLYLIEQVKRDDLI